MRIYSWGTKWCVARDEAEARARFGAKTVKDRTDELRALCDAVLGPTGRGGLKALGLEEHQMPLSSGHIIYGSERAVNFVRDALDVTKQMDDQALRREEDEHAHTRRLLEEQSASYRDLFDRHQKLSQDLIYANGRVTVLEKDDADQKKGINYLQKELTAARQANDSIIDRADRAEAALIEARAEINRLRTQLKQATQKNPDPAEGLAEATKEWLSGANIAPPETEAQPEPEPSPAAVTLSPLAQRHGDAVMQLLDSGHNPDEVCRELNHGLGRNDHLTPGIVGKIKAEILKKARRAGKAA